MSVGLHGGKVVVVVTTPHSELNIEGGALQTAVACAAASGRLRLLYGSCYLQSSW